MKHLPLISLLAPFLLVACASAPQQKEAPQPGPLNPADQCVAKEINRAVDQAFKDRDLPPEQWKEWKLSGEPFTKLKSECEKKTGTRVEIYQGMTGIGLGINISTPAPE